MSKCAPQTKTGNTYLIEIILISKHRVALLDQRSKDWKINKKIVSHVKR
jgi:hypothetical protein